MALRSKICDCRSRMSFFLSVSGSCSQAAPSFSPCPSVDRLHRLDRLESSNSDSDSGFVSAALVVVAVLAVVLPVVPAAVLVAVAAFDHDDFVYIYIWTWRMLVIRTFACGFMGC